MTKVGVTGGIGSGKSEACRIFARLGVPVYDSDKRAGELMYTTALRDEIIKLLGAEAYRGDEPDRTFIAGRVFGNRELLSSLEAIVHPAVGRDFEAWVQVHAHVPYVVLESAILFESGFDTLVDCVVAVSAPVETRIERVLARENGNVSAEQICARVASQMSDDDRERQADYVIPNTGTLEELARRIAELDKILKR